MGEIPGKHTSQQHRVTTMRELVKRIGSTRRRKVRKIEVFVDRSLSRLLSRVPKYRSIYMYIHDRACFTAYHLPRIAQPLPISTEPPPPVSTNTTNAPTLPVTQLYPSPIPQSENVRIKGKHPIRFMLLQYS